MTSVQKNRRTSVRRTALLLVAAGLIAAACGQKPGTHVATTAGVATGTVAAGDGSTPIDGVPADGTSTGADGTATPAATGAGSSTGAAAAGTKAPAASGSSAAAKPGATAGAAAGQTKVIGTDRTGASKDKLVVAIHAPVTGAAPLPATSFEKARDLYWRYITEVKKEKVLGRSTVEVLFKDDRYQPNTAVQACRELAAEAFALVGGGGTDQIQACARFANQARVPYFSAGVTENGLRGLPYYYATSMSYKQQGVLLTKYLAKNFAGKKVAAIVTDTPNFDDAVQGWEDGVKASGLNYYKTLRHPKGDTSWYNTFATELKNQGVEVLYVNSAPVDYIRFAQQAGEQGFKPQFVGVGVTMGINAVLGSGCPAVDKGIFFSPFPGIDWAQANLKEFFDTAAKFGAPADDLGVALWGNAAVFHQLLLRYEAKYGTDLTREGFRAVVEEAQGVKSNVFPELTFNPQDHFGANQVHVLQADCGPKTYKTLATFTSGF
jgi:ABC-type branched-subunit amino acid transport system substrate-binding protein